MSNKKIFKSRFVSNISKLKLYWTIISPLISYSRASRVLKEGMKQKLLITQRNILREFFRILMDTENTRRIK
jgi:hypothetical protein